MTAKASFGQRVAKARGRLTQPKLAEILGTSTATIKRIEGDKKKSTTFEKKGIALALVQKVGAAPELFAEELGFDAAPDPISLQRDVAALREQVRVLAEIVGRVPSSPVEELRRLREQLDANTQPPQQEPDEGQGR